MSKLETVKQSLSEPTLHGACRQLEQQFPTWEGKHLRTTSRLERFNRRIRHRARAANAYPSTQGVLALIAQKARAFHVTQRRDSDPQRI